MWHCLKEFENEGSGTEKTFCFNFFCSIFRYGESQNKFLVHDDFNSVLTVSVLNERQFTTNGYQSLKNSRWNAK
jgi:hypothetical protein